MKMPGRSRLIGAAFFVGACLLSTFSDAAQVVGQTAVTPAGVDVGVGTLVTVTSRIDDPSLLAASVNLQRIDAAGRVLETIGTLMDNGTGGDASAGDKVFTIQTTIYEVNSGPVTLRVSAAFAGKLLRAFSSPVIVNVVGAGSGLRITTPANLAYVNTSPIRVTGTAADGTTVIVNGVNAAVAAGTFTVSVPIQEGTNTLTAVATSAAGTTNSASVQVTLDTTPPHVAVNAPGDGYQTTAASISVSGTVNDIVVGTVNDQQARVTVNGVTAQVANRSFLAASVPLALGANTLQVTATDRAGNAVTMPVLVTRVAAQVATVRVVSGSGQTAQVGTVLPQPLVVNVTDGAGQPAANVPVVFAVKENSGGLVSGTTRLATLAATTNAQGNASAQFALGTRAGVGNNIVEASATGFAGPAVFTASGTATTPARIVVDTGNGQIGSVAQALPLPFIVIVTDASNNRLSNVPVVFTVRQGGGTFGGQTFINLTTDSDGRAAAVLTLGRQEGQDNNVVDASFAGNPGAPAAFLASARVPGNASDTRITGVVLDNSNHPISGVTMRVFRTHNGPGLPELVADPVETNEEGQFVIVPAPVGTIKLMADGSTAPSGPWPSIEFDLTTVAGQTNDVGLPIYLPALDTVNRLCVDATTGGTLTLPQVPGFSLTIAPGSATFPGGSRSGCVTVTPVNGDKVPMSPGFGQQPRFVVTIQPVGTTFNPPAAITLPNVDGLPPRAVTEMYSYDHDLAAFVAIGTGTVSEDGLVISSDPGVGVLKAGWHCGGNPNPTGSAGTCPECQKCQGSQCVPVSGGACDDHDACTKDDKCTNGVCTGTPIDTSSWTDDLSIQADVKLPTDIVSKVNKIFSYIPGLSGVKFKEARVGVSGRAKNCCEANGGIQELGLKEGQGTFQLTAQVANIPIWGTPTISREFDFSIAIVSVDFQFGLLFTTNFRINAQGGVRRNACDQNENCFFGETNVSLDPEIKTTFEAIACLETLWTSRSCGGLTITPLAVRMNIAGRLTYNKPSCQDGLTGSLALGKVVVRAEFSLDVPAAPQRLVFQYELFGGIGQL